MRFLYLLLVSLLPLATLAQGTTPTFQAKTIAELTNTPIPSVSGKITALVTGRVTENDGAGGLFFYQTNSTAALDSGTRFKPTTVNGRWLRQYSGALNVKWFAAIGDGVANDTTAIVNAISALTSAGGEVYFPAGTYVYNAQLVLPSNIALTGEPPIDAIFGGQSASSLVYTGSASPSIVVRPPAGVYYESITLNSLAIDGSRLGASSIDGIGLLGTNGSGAGVRGVFFNAVNIKNFTRYQVWLNENIFHIAFNGCNIENRDRSSGSDLVRAEGGAVGQLTYNDCWLSIAALGHWAHYGSTHETRFIGGTVEAAEGCNGVYVENTGIDIYGTHFESYNPARNDNIGIRYVGNIGGTILPSNVSIFGTGIQIGNPSSAASVATGVTIGGGYSGNNIGAGGKDLHIVAGGSRKGVVVLPSGTASSVSGAVVVNDRFTSDASMDVIREDLVQWQGNSAGGIFLPGGIAGSAITPALDLANNRLISWADHNGAKTLGGYFYVDPSDRMAFGAGNVTRMWLDKNGHLGIGQSSPNAAAIFEVASTTLGSLPIPRMTIAQRNAIASPPDGLVAEDVTGEPAFRVSGIWRNFLIPPIDLSTTNVTGNLGISHFNSGAGANASTYWRGDGQWVTNSGSGTNGGTVTSVAMTVPAFLSVAGSPITGAGTLAVTLSGTKLPLVNESSPTGSGFAHVTTGSWDAAARNPVLASSDFSNQGTATTLLHGNAAGNPSFGQANLATEVIGNLDVSHLNSGTGASGTTAWFGDNTWKSVTGTFVAPTGDGAVTVTGGVLDGVASPFQLDFNSSPASGGIIKSDLPDIKGAIHLYQATPGVGGDGAYIGFEAGFGDDFILRQEDTLGGFRFFTAGVGGGEIMNIDIPGNIKVKHIGGELSGAPAIAVGPAAGGSPTVALDASANDMSMTVTLGVGSAPTANATLFTITFSTPYVIAPHITFSASSASAAGLTTTAPFVDPANITTTQFVFTSNAVAMVGGFYKWTFHVLN